mmetsp:Transcript_10979/g.26474  ORF Transcript_10979/g.26474 Transcript_10979/m.26474 type:complete len:298 (-) Transcript_10979:457-1350(-)
MRIWALTGKGMVHPLSKKTSVQWHLALVVSDGAQALQELCLKLLGARALGHSVSGQVRHQRSELVRGRIGCADLSFERRKQPLTGVTAADRIEARGSKAIVEAAQVVCQQNMRPLRVRLVQGSKVSEILRALSEPPMVVVGLVVEVRKGNPPRFAASPLHVHQSSLELLTFLVVELRVSVANLPNHLFEASEIHTGIAITVRQVLLHQALQPPVHLFKAVVLLPEAQQPFAILHRVCHRDVPSNEKHQGVHVDHLEGGRAIKYGLRTLSHRFVDFLQLALRLLVHQVLYNGHHLCKS